MPASIYHVEEDDYGAVIPFIELLHQWMDQLVQKFQADSRNILILNLVEKSDINFEKFYHDLHRHIRTVNPDLILMLCLVEPHWALNHQAVYNRIIKPMGIPTRFLGWYSQPGADYIDIWSVLSNELFPGYSEEQLMPVLENADRFYLMHGRSHAPHRVSLKTKIDSLGLDRYGYISGWNKTIEDEGDTTDITKKAAAPDDPYSLGGLNIWNNTILNIVPAAFMFENTVEVYPNKSGSRFSGTFGSAVICEKYYKPIIGLRPFIVNGSYSTIVKLKEFGFDCFEDCYGISLDQLKTVDGIHRTITDTITMLARMPQAERLDWYRDLLPRLRANKQRYFEHSAEQRQILEHYQV